MKDFGNLLSESPTSVCRLQEVEKHTNARNIFSYYYLIFRISTEMETNLYNEKLHLGEYKVRCSRSVYKYCQHLLGKEVSYSKEKETFYPASNNFAACCLTGRDCCIGGDESWT